MSAYCVAEPLSNTWIGRRLRGLSSNCRSTYIKPSSFLGLESPLSKDCNKRDRKFHRKHAKNFIYKNIH